MKVGIVDYQMGNLASVRKAVEKLGKEALVSSEATELRSCDVVIVPGVGNFSAGMRNLQELGLVEPIRQWAGARRPIIGICLGLQLFFEHSDEGDTQGLGILKGRVVKLPEGQKIPHMGWNEIASSQSALFQPMVGKRFYFVHSYVCEPAGSFRSATTDYGQTFVSAIEADNVLGFQFHPEKSAADGLSLLDMTLEEVA